MARFEMAVVELVPLERAIHDSELMPCEKTVHGKPEKKQVCQQMRQSSEKMIDDDRDHGHGFHLYAQ